jgi:hypothetical protein
MHIRAGRWAVSVGAAGVLLAWALLSQRDAPGSLLPHGYCFTWNPTLLWTHVASDSLIGLAYVSIPLTLVRLVRQRVDLPFDWIVLLFAIFIVSCGATHWIEVWTVWHPDYWLSASVKAVTAVASILTAIALGSLLPRILAIPSVDALQNAASARSRGRATSRGRSGARAAARDARGARERANRGARPRDRGGRGSANSGAGGEPAQGPVSLQGVA